MKAIIGIVRPAIQLIRVLIPVGFLVAGVFAAMALFSARPTPARIDRVETAVAVRTMDIERGPVRLDVHAWGEVTARRTLLLQPQVSGRLIELSPLLSPGSVMEAGTIVARIDPRDFELMLQQATATLATAQFNLELEQGRSRIASRDRDLLGDIAGDLDLDDEAMRLALRLPHLHEAETAVETARSKVEQAQLALDRTILRAPFRAMVQAQTAVLGSMVGPTSVVATLVGVDAWWVEAGVPLGELSRVTLPDADGLSAGIAEIEVQMADGNSSRYAARIIRLLGRVDSAGRQARVLLQVDDPLGQSSSQEVPLLLGSYVSALLQGPERSDVLRLPRSVLREGDVLWVLGTDSRLDIRPVNVLSGALDTVVVKVDLDPGERIISSSVPAPMLGLLLVDEASG
jgi:RND family efflux transporter MFP subunit